MGSRAPVPHDLQIQLISFIGREREIGQVKGFLSRTRLLTLTGAGGVGKTRLAFRVAAQALEDFSDGVVGRRPGASHLQREVFRNLKWNFGSVQLRKQGKGAPDGHT